MAASKPRTVWFTQLAVLLLELVGTTQGFSTCQSFDLDDYKSKRIEAVRGQILSKLRIRGTPEPDTSAPPEDVPLEVMLLYNSTRELMQAESTCERESSEEDYYAKEVQRVDMQPPRIDTSESRL